MEVEEKLAMGPKLGQNLHVSEQEVELYFVI